MLNEKRMAAFRKLEPLAAVQSWLNGDFSFGEESALCGAIRKDPRIQSLDDDAISDAICEAMDEESDAAATLERIAAAAR